jgi:hypothetical protein
MNFLINNYPLILLVIILLNIFLSERKKVSNIFKSTFDFIYLRKLHRYAHSKFEFLDLKEIHAFKFCLFAGTYMLAYALFSLHYFGLTPLHNRFSMSLFDEKPGFNTLYQIKDDIPKNASVSVPSDIGVLLCERENVYLFPIVKGAEYIVFDINHRNADEYWALSQIIDVLKTNQYGIFKKRGRFVILKKGLPLDGVADLMNEIRQRSN